MGTTQFDSLVPRLYAVETDLGAIRRDLRAAILAARPPASAEDAVESAAQPAPSIVEPEVAQEPQLPEASSLAPGRTRGRSFAANDVESLLGGRWLHIAGLLLVFIGTAFFLKVAFDHNWIAPVFRVALGLVAGAVTIVYAQRLANNGQRYFSEGITALGAGIEFLSLYACNALFHLASPAYVLGGMVAVNAVIAALAWRRHSERLGVLAAIGGFLAPMLAGTQSADQWMLAGYVGVLDAGLLLLAELVESRVIAPIALAGTLVYSVGSFSYAHSLSDVQRAIIYVCLYATFAVAGWIVTKRRGTRDISVQSVVSAIAISGLFGGLETSLFPDHRIALAATLLGLTIAHLGMSVVLKSRYNSWLAVAALTLAIPAAFDKPVFVNVAWAAEAAVLAIAGLRFRDNVLKNAGLGLLALTVVRDAFVYADYVPKNPIFNERFAAGAAAFVAAFVIARALDLIGTGEHDSVLVRILRTAGHAIAAVALSAEAWDAVAHYGGTPQASSAALSVTWAIFAAILVGCGLRKNDSFMRWEGLALIVLTVGKVLLLDLSFLDIGSRVVSAVLVGVALIGVSYVYQRRLPKDAAQS
jgi:uncharacterized membrane protein